jgi:hypothetical protein
VSTIGSDGCYPRCSEKLGWFWSPSENSESSLFQASMSEYKPVYETRLGLLFSHINDWVAIFHLFIACYSMFHSRTSEPWNQVRWASTDREIFWGSRLRCSSQFQQNTLDDITSQITESFADCQKVLGSVEIICHGFSNLIARIFENETANNKQ